MTAVRTPAAMSTEDAEGEEEAVPCSLLPDTFGTGPLGDVMRLPRNYTIMLSYLTDGERLQALLPTGLTVAGEPVVSFRFRRSEGIDWAESSCHVVAATVTVEATDAQGATVRGMHFLTGWEDDPVAAILGRELGGTVKLPGTVAFDDEVNGTSRMLLHHRGRPLIEGVFRRVRPFSEGELADLREVVREVSVVGFKALPSVDGRALGEHYTTEVPMRAEVDTAWFVDGDVTLYETTVETVHWHHRAIRSLRSLPLLEKRPGVLTTGALELYLNRARRLA